VTRKNIKIRIESIRRHTDNYTIVAFYPGVFQGSLFIFYHWEGMDIGI
jgi:hypothetical protein